jgi:hypothetical protein
VVFKTASLEKVPFVNFFAHALARKTSGLDKLERQSLIAQCQQYKASGRSAYLEIPGSFVGDAQCEGRLLNLYVGEGSH